MKISALNRKLHRAFGGRVTAALADGCIVLRGELDRWDDVVRAGQMAATKYSTCHVVNDITFTGGKDAPMRVPALHDDALDGQTPDVLIIGGGISGVSIARELARQKLDILVVDKECDLALGASGRNDGEVHPGIDLGRGSIKHKYIRRGNAMYDQVCKELDVPFHRVGQYVCFQHGWLRPAVWGYCMWRKYHDGIADTELIYWPARSGLHLVTHDDDAVPVRSATYHEARMLQSYREAQHRYRAGGGYQSSLRGAEKDLRRMLLDLSGGDGQ